MWAFENYSGAVAGSIIANLSYADIASDAERCAWFMRNVRPQVWQQFCKNWERELEAYFPDYAITYRKNLVDGEEVQVPSPPIHEQFFTQYMEVLDAVSNDYFGQGLAKIFQSDVFRRDEGIVLAAVKRNGSALAYASAELRNDREFVLAAVKRNGSALAYVSAELRNDREVVLAAVRRNGWVLQYASAELRNDREVVLAAVRQNGRALKYASAELKNDWEVVSVAEAQDYRALQYAGKASGVKPSMLETKYMSVADGYEEIYTHRR